MTIVFSVKFDVFKISYRSETDRRLKYIFGYHLGGYICLSSAIVHPYVHPMVQTLGCTFNHNNFEFSSVLDPREVMIFVF